MSINHFISPDIEPKLDLYAKTVNLAEDTGLQDNWVQPGPSFLTSPNSTFSNITVEYYNFQISSVDRTVTVKFCGTVDVDIPNLGVAKIGIDLSVLPVVELYYSRFNIQSPDAGVLTSPGNPKAAAKLYLNQNMPQVFGGYIEYNFVLPISVFSPTNSYTSANNTIDCELSYSY